jgi:hypothetical protein
MPSGAPPGGHPGAGRPKGSKNKRTLTQVRKAERELKQSAAALVASGRKLAKDRLAELADVFFKCAMRFRPDDTGNFNSASSDGIIDGGAGTIVETMAQFEKWSSLAMDAYGKAAPYQSPALRAVVIAQPKVEEGKTRSAEELFAEILMEMGNRGLLPGVPKMIEGVANREGSE